MSQPMQKYWAFSFSESPSEDFTEPFYKVEDVAQAIKPFLKDFIEWNACVAKDYDKGIYHCDQCHNLYNKDGTGCQHEEGCLVVEAQRLIAQMEHDTK